MNLHDSEVDARFRKPPLYPTELRGLEVNPGENGQISPNSPHPAHTQNPTGDVDTPARSDAELKGSSGFVYIIEAVGLSLFKVGITADVQRRLTKMRTDSPVELCLVGVIGSPDFAQVERQFHKRLDPHWERGEWFRDCEELREIITTLSPPESVGVSQTEGRKTRRSTPCRNHRPEGRRFNGRRWVGECADYGRLIRVPPPESTGVEGCPPCFLFRRPCSQHMDTKHQQILRTLVGPDHPHRPGLERIAGGAQ